MRPSLCVAIFLNMSFSVSLLLSLSVLLYPFECGGLTQDIAALSNESVTLGLWMIVYLGVWLIVYIYVCG